MKKILLFASLALAAVAFAAPGSASATNLTILDNGDPVHNGTAEFTGPMTFETLGTGLECIIHAEITINTDDVDLTDLEITTNTCNFFGFLYEECEFETSTPGDIVTGLPWGIDVTGADELTLTNSTSGGAGLIDMHLKNRPPGTCYTTQTDVTFSDVTLDVGTVSGKIHDLALSGEVVMDDAFGEHPVGIAGTLTIWSGDTGTYEIG